jgi:gluconate 2-dehydrogenase gamma chain
MSGFDRRKMLRLLGAAPIAAGFVWTDAEAQTAHHQAQAARQTARKTGTPFKPKFFTPHEYATIVVLVDLIIPKDERSGSATDAGVPEFMDFIMLDQEERQTAIRGGLAWLDRECERRFDKRFVDCMADQRTAILDDISVNDPAPAEQVTPPAAEAAPPSTPSAARELPGKQGDSGAPSELSHGIQFFRSFRDLTASGFWTSKMGMADLKYMGNQPVLEWKGCPDEALRKLGVSNSQ